MDDALNALLSWQFMLFSLSIYTIVFVIRTFTEYFWKNATNNDLWNKLILRLLPISVGATIAFFSIKFSFPDNLRSFSGREMFGIVSGLFSSMIYALVKDNLQGRIQKLTNNIANKSDVHNRGITDGK